MTRGDKIFLRFAGVLILLLGFGAILGGAYVIVDEVCEARAVQGARVWRTTKAQILELSRDVTSSSKGAKHVRIHCRYKYAYEGREYVGTNVDMQGDSAELGAWKERLYCELLAAKVAGNPIECYVDSESPSRAVLYRSFRPSGFWFTAWVGYVTIGFGFLFAVFAVHGLRARALRDRLEQAHPDAPWMWNPVWHEKTMRPQASVAPFLWIAGVYGVVGAVPLALFVCPVLLKESGSLQGIVLTALGMALPPIVLVAAAVLTARRWAVRNAFLRLDTVPVLLGRDLRGELVLGPRATPPEVVCARLELVRSVSKGRRSHTSRVVVTEVEALPAIKVQMGDSPTFCVRIPTDSAWPGHDDADPQDKTLWNLHATIGRGWRRARLLFDLPVFAERKTRTASMATEEATQ